MALHESIQKLKRRCVICCAGMYDWFLRQRAAVGCNPKLHGLHAPKANRARQGRAGDPAMTNLPIVTSVVNGT